METLGTTADERFIVKKILKRKFGTIEKAAEKIHVSKYTLSRVLNGQSCDLETIIKILKGSGHLENKKYIFPKSDWKTFCFCNGITFKTLV